MKMQLRLSLLLAALTAAILSEPDTAYAYGGPGSIITGIGALLAVLAAIGAAIFGFIWFPAKRLLRKMSNRKVENTMDPDLRK
jgi:hypothetical protein